MSDFGFVGAAYSAPSITQDAQECINWYPEIDPTKQDAGSVAATGTQATRGVVALYPTPGLTAKLTLGAAAEVRGMYVLPGGQSMLTVCGPTLYLISASFSAVVKGTLVSSSGLVSITDNGIDAYIVDGSNRYTYTISTGVFSTVSISDGAFQGADKVDYLYDYFIYSRPGTNQWAASNPLSSITPALSFSSADSSPGNLVSLIADHGIVYLIGEKVTEFWTNAGSFPFPLQRIPNVVMQHGCVAKNSVTRLGESVAWLSQDGRGQAVMIQIVGYGPQRISTHAVENDISSGVISDAICYAYQQEGHEFLMLILPTQDKTWCYDLATQMWHKRAYRDSSNVLHRHRGNCHALFQGLNLVGDYQNGKIYAFDRQTYTDDGAAILRMRRCQHLTSNLNRVFYESLQIQFQPGVGLVTGQGSNPQMMLRWSDDGGFTWSSYYPVSIGVLGAYKNRAIKRRMGFARDRVFEVTITDPVNAVIVSANIETSAGAH